MSKINKEAITRAVIEYGEARVAEASVLYPLNVASAAIDTFAFNLDSYRSDGDIRQAVFNALLHFKPTQHLTVGQVGTLLNIVISEIGITERE